MKVYVSHDDNEYRINLRPYGNKVGGVRQVDIPESAGRLLLALMASSDALQDTLERIFNQHSDAELKWED